jgi:hypothetical protein
MCPSPAAKPARFAPALDTRLVSSQHSTSAFPVDSGTSNNVPKLVFTLKIPRQLEYPCQMRPNLIGTPQWLHAFDTHLPGHRARTPALSSRRRLYSLGHDSPFQIRAEPLATPPWGASAKPAPHWRKRFSHLATRAGSHHFFRRSALG